MKKTRDTKNTRRNAVSTRSSRETLARSFDSRRIGREPSPRRSPRSASRAPRSRLAPRPTSPHRPHPSRVSPSRDRARRDRLVTARRTRRIASPRDPSSSLVDARRPRRETTRTRASTPWGISSRARGVAATRAGPGVRYPRGVNRRPRMMTRHPRDRLRAPSPSPRRTPRTGMNTEERP